VASHAAPSAPVNTGDRRAVESGIDIVCRLRQSIPQTMASAVFIDWISSILNGNSVERPRGKDSISEDVIFDAAMKVTLSAAMKTQRVSNPEGGASIESAEKEAYSRADPMSEVDWAVRHHAAAYLVREGRHPVDGWQFSET